MTRQIIASFFVLAAGSTSNAEVDYLREVKPILQKRCYACHGVLKQQSGLRVDTAESMRKGSESGAVIVPGDAEESLLYQVITGQAGFRMPPETEGSKVEPEEIARIAAWINSGANAPEDEEPQQDPRSYWSYQLPLRPPLPDVNNLEWIQTPIDTFIAAEHEQRGLTPQPPADKAVLLRRIYLDLIGLPPSREELQAFLADESPDAYERVVDDLLNRPQYGQRWGRHWMDVWRYSDWYGSRGINEIRYSQRHIWRWRDWIVDSLNDDKAYDRMIVEMLAGDELAPGNPDVAVATGFLGRNWYKFDRNVWMFDTVERTSQSLMALTLRCCRCHDHKYDPLSHQDYYRFRAFFEPHDVRTDRISAATETEKDATLGQVLKDGVALVFDKHLDRPTYRFLRGDDRNPDKERELSPGVPAALGNHKLDIASIALPTESFYPALRPTLSGQAIELATAKVSAAKASVVENERLAAAAKADLDRLTARGEDSKVKQAVFLSENFAKPNSEVWETLNGEWVYENGKLVEKQVTSFATIATKTNHPRNFRARMKYRPLQAGTYRSIGFSFDFVDKGQSQDVYTATSDASQSVQAFHREGGKQNYPQAGIVKTSLKVGKVATVEVTARGQDLKIWLNGELKLEYVMPMERRDGKFAIWVHQGSAEFLELEIKKLVPTIADLRRRHRETLDQVSLRQQQVLTAEAEVESLRTRMDAERAKYDGVAEAEIKRLADLACRAERTVAVRRADEELLKATQHLAAVSGPPASENDQAKANSTRSSAMADARKKLVAAEAKRAEAQRAAESPDGTYTALGEVYPATSTGRRLALARWIANEQNPRTARVAVNHIWLRHFGEALVPTVANFGLNGKRPSHPELLDWLAVELMESGWSMKHVHRLMVLSATYRMSSRGSPGLSRNPPEGSTPTAIDPENRYFWRMNSRRMEAELVRDSILAATTELDLSFGGAEIPEGEGETNRRRSMYFRLTPNDKMKFLELFDVADPNSCYRRIESVIPQQALAISNSKLALTQARVLALQLTNESGPEADAVTNGKFVATAFETILSRAPSDDEQAACSEFLSSQAELLARKALTKFSGGSGQPATSAAAQRLRARENLVHVLLNHNDFVTIR